MTVAKRKPLQLDVLEEAARVATREALMEADLSGIDKSDLVLGSRSEDDEVVFELYVPGSRPEDARFLTRTRVDAYSGQVLSVEVWPEGQLA